MQIRGGTPPPFRLEPLDEAHPIAGFSSGDPAIDAFLHAQALAEQLMGLSSTTIAVERVRGSVMGFYSLSPLSIRLDTRLLAALQIDAHSVPYPMVGGYLLGRLGTSTSCQNQGIGSALVAIAVEQVRRIRRDSGGVFLAVDAKTERLVGWYTSLGFKRVGQGNRLVLKL